MPFLSSEDKFVELKSRGDNMMFLMNLHSLGWYTGTLSWTPLCASLPISVLFYQEGLGKTFHRK